MCTKISFTKILKKKIERAYASSTLKGSSIFIFYQKKKKPLENSLKNNHI